MVEDPVARRWDELLLEARLFPSAYDESLAVDRAYQERTVDSLRGARLADLLQRAAGVPFYRAWAGAFAAGSAEARLTRLPLLTKATIRGQLADLCADDISPGQARMALSSGTSGEPVRFVLDNRFLTSLFASALARRRRAGLGLHLKFLRPCQTSHTEWFEYTSPGRGLARVADFGWPAEAGDRHKLLARAGDFRPDVISVNPAEAVLFADLLDESGPRLAPRLLTSTGETLDPGLRKRLTDHLGCPVIDLYGLKEVGTVAAQCLEGALHIETERVLLEVLDEDGQPAGPGRPGELVVTGLTNLTMPLLRYRTGDTGRLDTVSCPCGVNGEVLSDLAGRHSGTFTLSNGHALPVLVLARELRDRRVSRYQIAQRSTCAIRVCVALAAPADGAWLEEVTRRLRVLVSGFDPAVTVEVDTGDFIRAPSGKVPEVMKLPE